MKKVFLIFAILLLTGCKKCIKSHVEDSICTYVMYNGKTTIPYTMPCKRKVCDVWEEESEE